MMIYIQWVSVLAVIFGYVLTLSCLLMGVIADEIYAISIILVIFGGLGQIISHLYYQLPEDE